MSMQVLKHLLFEVHQATALCEYERFQDFDRESMGILLDSFKSFADQDLFPYYKEMDDKPVTFTDGQVQVHPQIRQTIAKSAELGLIGCGFDYERGGMQLPAILYYAILHILDSANNNVTGYTTLTGGAANLIVTFGSEELIATYVPPMIEGRWMGTMALTEPQAGSSLSDITTTAYPRPDGSYLIKGQKIFISGGDHQYGENFVHLTLARIEGAPAGTKGISLFVVPKLRPTPDGSLVHNDLVTAGEFEKLGQRGYVTTHLVYGEQDNCLGWLVGEPHHGLKYMFQMMNEARISVGTSAASMATAAYYASLQYANERRQGRVLGRSGKKDVRQEQAFIARHPDVKRMLLLQKSVVEGSISLALECARLADLHAVESDATAEDALDLLELLTPVVKAYPSEMGRVSISNGLQVLGGYGFTSDFILQQYYRDVRITSIYEGTTGIQALDLLGRKVPMKGGRSLTLLLEAIQTTIDQAKDVERLQPYAAQLAEKVALHDQVLRHLGQYAASGDYERYLADATPYLEFFGTMTVAWQWLKMAAVSHQLILEDRGSYTTEFYQEQVDTMRFFYKYELPKMTGLAETLLNPETLTLAKREGVAQENR